MRRWFGRWRLFGLLVLFGLLPIYAGAVEDVAETVHNLSTSGPGRVKSLNVDEVCVFCHTPHSASPSVPLWNRAMSGATYAEYDSSTLQAAPGQPTGKSRLCLSCHDGTVALGALINPPQGRDVDLAQTFLIGRSNLGTDLSDDHPVSFAYDNALQARVGQLVPPRLVDMPLENGELQCGSCHDPHEKNTVPFLRRTTLNGELCAGCHDIGSATTDWESSSHATSAARPSGGANPWSERKPEWRGQTVAENSCFNCHTPHNALTPPRLIKDREEATCFRCHDGGVAATDIKRDTQKLFRHPVDLTEGIHDPREEYGLRPPDDHVECADCHNTHAVQRRPASAPRVTGANLGVSGIDSSGGRVAEAANQYEVCFKCHADNNVVRQPLVTRRIVEMNTRIEFDRSNPSFHPVQGVGRNRNVPSLLPPLTETSIIYCTDCHGSDSSPAAGGTGAGGPHGSVYEGLLERNYATADDTAESSVAYALCYKCHDRSNILADRSFKKHGLHVVDQKTPCAACHDSHGVSSIGGNPTNNSNLINFDATIVEPNALGVGPVFEDMGTFSGECSLSCHGKDHDRLGY